MFEILSTIYSIPQWNGIKTIDFKGYTAYIIDYIRGSVAGKENVHVYNMIVSTEAHDWTIIFAFRDNSLSKWISSFRDFGESFEFSKQETIKQQSSTKLSSYNIPGTSQHFNWYRAPSWKSEYSEGIKLNSFHDENYGSDGYMNINISIMDLTGLVSGKFAQLGFLIGVQQQVPMQALEMMKGLNVRVKKNSIDSEHNIYTYQYLYSISGMNVEGIIIYSFSGSKCIVFASEWESNHPKIINIIDEYITEII